MKKVFKKCAVLILAAVLCLSGVAGVKMTAKAEDREAYVQVTDVAKVLDGGEFVIVAAYNGKYYAMDDAVHAKKIDPKEVSVANGEVTGDLPVWTLETMGTGVSILGDLGYISYKEETDFYNAKNGKATDPFEWHIEAKEDGKFRIYRTFEADTVVVGFRDNVDGGNILKFGPFPLQSVASSSNVFVLEMMFFEKTVVTETPSIDDTADINTAPLYAVLVLGVAVVAFASKKRFAR